MRLTIYIVQYTQILVVPYISCRPNCSGGCKAILMIHHTDIYIELRYSSGKQWRFYGNVQLHDHTSQTSSQKTDASRGSCPNHYNITICSYNTSWPTLESRRHNSRLIQMHKIVHNTPQLYIYQLTFYQNSFQLECSISTDTTLQLSPPLFTKPSFCPRTLS